MTTYRTHFRWSLPPEAATVARYVATLTESVGYPCLSESVKPTSTGVAAALAFPRISKNNLLILSNDLCELDFAPVPFFWAHATNCVKQLGGAFMRPVLSDRPEWKRRQWRELRWTDRARILVGLNSWEF